MSVKGRPAFTLVEVALAVAVGLIILGGVVVGYGAIKEQASSGEARRRVNLAAGTIVEYAAANGGLYPVSGTDQFTAMWARKFADNYNKSPWGGLTGQVDGVAEYAPITAGGGDRAGAPDVTSALTQSASEAGSLIYVEIQGNRYASLRPEGGDIRYAKGYVLSIYDRLGHPWYHLATGQ